FAATGLAVRAVPLGEVPLVGIGLGTTDELLSSRPDELRAVVQAVGRAVADIVADPEGGVGEASEAMPGRVSERQRAIMSATMQAALPLYGDRSRRFGQDTGPWEGMSAILADAGLTDQPVTADEAYTDALTGAE